MGNTFMYGGIVLIALYAAHEPHAQAASHGPVEVRRLDSSPYTPGKDPDIDLYMRHWSQSMPYALHGALVARDVLSKGDPAKPSRKGEVLRYVNRFVHATLPSGASTSPITLSGEQEVYFILSGSGVLETGGKSVEIGGDYFLMIPSGTPCVMKNTGKEPMTMYLVAEPTPHTFKPRREARVVNARELPITTAQGHWSMIIRTAFNIVEDLAVIQYVNLITFDPMTIGHPHAHLPGCEEVWTAVDGSTTLLFLGKQLRNQPPGTAYLCPPYGDCTHSNINGTDRPARFLYFAVRQDWEKNDGIRRTVE